MTSVLRPHDNAARAPLLSRIRSSPAFASSRDPLIAWLIVAAFDLAAAALRGVHTAAEAATQWWTAVDAQIPELTARWFLYGGEFLGGRWHASARGPLQPLILLMGGEWGTTPRVAYVIGVVLNASWVVGLWVLLRALGFERKRIAFAVSLVALTGPVWLNTVYPWPKLLSAAFTMGLIAAVLRKRALLAGLLAGLALLAHGSALFALVGSAPWIANRLRARGAATLIVALAVYAPWFVYGTVVDPPNDRLMKWHFAGTDIGTHDGRDFPRALIDEYRDAGTRVIGYRIDNIRYALGDPTIYRAKEREWTAGWLGGLGTVRRWQITRIIWAPGLLLLGPLLWILRRRWREPKGPGELGTLAGLGAGWFLAYVLIEWGGNADSIAMMHSAPFALVVAFPAVCALRCNRWMLGAQIAAFIGLWLMAPTALG